MKTYVFDAVIHEEDDGGAYVIFPYDVRAEFSKGRVRVHVLFDDIPYDGSIVNMGLKDEQGGICWLIGVRKDIRRKLNKADGDTVRVSVCPRI